MFDRRIVTLNIEDSSVRGLILKGRRVERWGSMPLAPGLVREGLVLQPKTVGQAIGTLLESMGTRKGKVIVSLTGLRSVSRLLVLPRVKRALLEEAIQRGAKKEMAVPLEELYLSWLSVDGKANELEFFILGVPRDLVDAEVQTLKESGVKPYILDLKPLALARVINRREALIIDLEPDSFGITLVVGGTPVIMRTITPKREGVILEDVLRQLTEELSRIVEFYNQGHPENPIGATTPAFLTGELSGDAATVALVRAGMEYPVVPLSSPLECLPDFPIASYAVNIGLALKKVPAGRPSEGAATGFRDIDLNALPDRYGPRRWPIRYILFSLSAMIALGGLFPAYEAKTAGDAEAERMQVDLYIPSRQAEQVRLDLDKDKAFKNTLDEVVATTQSLEQGHQAIFARRGELVRSLQSVAGALPSGARLTSIIIDPGQITVKGEADSPSVSISYAKALELQFPLAEVSMAELGDTTFSIALKLK